VDERVGIAGSGEIACGLAAVASQRGPVSVWARSQESADRVRSALSAAASGPSSFRVDTDLGVLAETSFVLESVVEDQAVKADVLSRLDQLLDDSAVLATTTSSLPVEALAQAAGRPDRFVGFHVFNPVEKMALVELAFPAAASAETRRRGRALCEALGKTAVEVPADAPGFVVNRLLFPFLFDAVRLVDDGRLDPEQVDSCMKLGAGHPMGPLALLDLVGLDVAAAIGEAIGVEVPERLRDLVAEGALGRKAGRGFYTYG
jgi:3-hydroxybutyryl-CoA dehydrogenase